DRCRTAQAPSEYRSAPAAVQETRRMRRSVADQIDDHRPPGRQASRSVGRRAANTGRNATPHGRLPRKRPSHRVALNTAAGGIGGTDQSLTADDSDDGWAELAYVVVAGEHLVAAAQFDVDTGDRRERYGRVGARMSGQRRGVDGVDQPLGGLIVHKGATRELPGVLQGIPGRAISDRSVGVERVPADPYWRGLGGRPRA